MNEKINNNTYGKIVIGDHSIEAEAGRLSIDGQDVPERFLKSGRSCSLLPFSKLFGKGRTKVYIGFNIIKIIDDKIFVNGAKLNLLEQGL